MTLGGYIHVYIQMQNVQFLVHLSLRLKCTIVVTRCPSSVVNFSHVRLLLWTAERKFNKTWQEARSQRPLQLLCFRTDRKNKMAALASDWLKYFQLLLWNRWTEFNETGSKISTSLYNFCVFWTDRKNKMAALAFYWLRLFGFLFWNRWTEFNETWQDARFQRPRAIKFVFLGRWEKQHGRSGFWLAKTLSTSPL